MRTITTALLAAALALIAAASPAGAQDAGKGPPILIVTGSATITVKPDLATVKIGVVSRAKTLEEAQNETSRKMTSTLEAIKAVGISADKLQTSALSISPIRPRPALDATELPPVIGYETSNKVSVRVEDIGNLVAVVTAGLAAEANELDGVYFGVQDDAPLRSRALAEASRDARRQADAIAEATGVRTVSIRRIINQGAGLSGPFGGFDLGGYGTVGFGGGGLGGGALGGYAATPVESGEVRMVASVTIAYRVAKR